MKNKSSYLYLLGTFLSTLTFSVVYVGRQTDFYYSRSLLFALLSLSLGAIILSINLFIEKNKIMKILNWVSLGACAVNILITFIALFSYKYDPQFVGMYTLAVQFYAADRIPLFMLNIPYLLLLTNLLITEFYRQREEEKLFDFKFVVLVTILSCIAFSFTTLESTLNILTETALIIVPVITYLVISIVNIKKFKLSNILLHFGFYLGFTFVYFMLYVQMLPVIDGFLVKYICGPASEVYASFIPLFVGIKVTNTNTAISTEKFAFIFNYALIYSIVFSSIYVCISNRRKINSSNS